MILEQHYVGCPAPASYLVADERSGVAAVVDPQRGVDQYLEAAGRVACRIRHVFLTHFHTDFLAGHLELRDRVGRLPERVDQLTRERELVVYCSSGYRSAIAASLVLGQGFERVADLAGGIVDWDSVGPDSPEA